AAPATNTPLATATAPPGAAIERVVPVTQNASIASPSLSTDVTVELVSNLGAYEVLITFDSSIVAYSSATNDAFLGSTGRTVFCPAPVLTTVVGTTKQLHFGCVTSGSGSGPSGAGTLATITWTPLSLGTTQFHLAPSLADPLGNSIFAVAYDGSAVIDNGPTPTPTFTPTPCPGGICPTDTPTNTPTVTPTFTPTPVIDCGVLGLAVCVLPLAETESNGTSFNAAIAIQQSTNVGAFQLTLSFDPTLVDATSISAGPFIGSTGRTLFCLPATIATGTAQLTCVTLGNTPPGPNGNGVLASVAFDAIGEGVTPLTLSDVLVTDVSGTTFAAQTISGSRAILSSPW
ncbi:MAG: hypothetical protein EPO22_15660, partial [Dehalococcoidia bacterium]